MLLLSKDGINLIPMPIDFGWLRHDIYTFKNLKNKGGKYGAWVPGGYVLAGAPQRGE
jgi:hypothetical protein